MAGQLGIESGGAGDLRDHLVEALELELNLLDELAALFVCLGVSQRLGRRARRRQRVLQLMGDVGGKTIARLEAAEQGRRHLGEGLGELAHFVAPV